MYSTPKAELLHLLASHVVTVEENVGKPYFAAVRVLNDLVSHSEKGRNWNMCCLTEADYSRMFIGGQLLCYRKVHIL